ncbi:type II toxin-antitoxin system HicA family toxin [Paraclostridium bifermentans]|uniref:type II toxin-antitoxin system HicA family toxin n=1 Tax=Paraclostridium bifermentans TaxID=1490 RepID=UPI0011570F29|nr:type II toxin-antitoxin system HicA family toxin [Paraclostridium bifermentans]TQO55584.1 type II toxin-antitoxin system HicA family toxin [Paraclostridium bifermentans]
MFENLKDMFLSLINENLQLCDGEDDIVVVTLIATYKIFVEKLISKGEIGIDIEGEPDHSIVKVKYNFVDRATESIRNHMYFKDREELIKKLRKLITPQELYKFLDEIGEEIYININRNESYEEIIDKGFCSLIAFELVSLPGVISFLNETSILEINAKCDLFKDRYKADYFNYENAMFRDKESFMKFYSSLSKKEKNYILELKEKAEYCYLNSKDYTESLTKEQHDLLIIADLFSMKYNVSMYSKDEIKIIIQKCVHVYEDLLIEKYDSCINEINTFSTEISNFIQETIDNIEITSISDINGLVKLNLENILKFISNNLTEINSNLEFINKYTKIHTKNINLFTGMILTNTKKVRKSNQLLSEKYNYDMGFFWMWCIIENVKEVMLYYMNYFTKTIMDNYNTYLMENKQYEGSLKVDDQDFYIDKKINKLLSYKQLNKIAKDRGFEKIRQNGDHGIFKNQGGDVVIIPQGRTIAKGLNLKIQKDIYNI